MAEDDEALIEFAPAVYPDVEGVTVDEQRRVWVMAWLLNAGKGAASAAAVIKEAKALEDYLAGSTPTLKAV